MRQTGLVTCRADDRISPLQGHWATGCGRDAVEVKYGGSPGRAFRAPAIGRQALVPYPVAAGLDLARASSLVSGDARVRRWTRRAMPIRRHRNDTAEANDLGGMGRRLDRCRAQARRRWRNYQAIDEALDPTSSAAAHTTWSNTVDEALRIAEAISREPAHDLAELATKFEALWWWIVEDDSVLDATTRRWLARFRRSLIQLTGRV